MAILLATIRTEDRFVSLWEKIKIFGGAVQAEHQLLDNNEVYSVLAYIARPKSKLKMDTWLGQSVWDSTVKEKYLLGFPVTFTRPSFILYFSFL